MHFTGSFTDPGPHDTHTIVWTFGDGTFDVSETLTPVTCMPTTVRTR